MRHRECCRAQRQQCSWQLAHGQRLASFRWRCMSGPELCCALLHGRPCMHRYPVSCDRVSNRNISFAFGVVGSSFSFRVFPTRPANLTPKCLPKQGGMPAFFSWVFVRLGCLDSSRPLFEVIFGRGVPPRALESRPCRPSAPE